jgi:hypothetical protein
MSTDSKAHDKCEGCAYKKESHGIKYCTLFSATIDEKFGSECTLNKGSKYGKKLSDMRKKNKNES